MKKIAVVSCLILITTIVLWSSCSRKSAGVQVYIDKPFTLLSEYRFFSGNPADLQPAEGVLPYDLITPLFTDYAEKARFVWMPEGTSANYDEKETFDFPEDAVLIKNFFYHNDERDHTQGTNVVETRLLVKKNGKWEAHTYIWNKEQTDAELKVAGATLPVSWIDAGGNQRSINYVVPNKNQCKGCHNHDEVLTPIGPRARNLNKALVYLDGEKNQLDKWVESGYLKGYTPGSEAPRLANWADPKSGTLHQRAMAYLEINCGHCHNAHGPANTSGLFLMADEKDPGRIGVMKTPVAAGRGSGGFRFSIVPGHPEESILLFRMDSDDPGIMMPELGRTVIHTEGVELIRAWIAAMK
jgi:uncharacterized repeat protein (TIGR03806 family)